MLLFFVWEKNSEGKGKEGGGGGGEEGENL